MKLSDRTIAILKNFASINQCIGLFEGSELKTQTAQKNIFAKAKIAESFPVTVGIFDLARLLSSMSLFKEADLTFEAKHLTIKGGSSVIKYMYAPMTMLKGIPDKDKSLYVDDFKLVDEFKMTQDMFVALMKAMSVLQVQDIIFKADGSKLRAIATNKKNPTSDSYEVVIGDCEKSYEYCFEGERLKLIAGDYTVKLLGANIGHFQTTDVEYFIAVQI